MGHDAIMAVHVVDTGYTRSSPGFRQEPQQTHLVSRSALLTAITDIMVSVAQATKLNQSPAKMLIRYFMITLHFELVMSGKHTRFQFHNETSSER